ncbi:type II toxin-antitoxin system RelE/ParE family toxin [Aerococcus sp. UMB7834]|uniref:type II toxin-antitoxin system RelE/ParE family toxin n=1 Tax=Aerococcus sp. UMB7834 TaxID=3046342 RepID=UPI00254C9E7C|nr:type II toxin-antitoxin system RelE/ParE family toxin [Aerococcus sp. UMB7834]MDK6805376.1 type II toxin-antitoxin system RelE/ParE family toxin [Aerococcus sp. UMB7834]
MNLDYRIYFRNNAKRELKKLKDKGLMKLIRDEIYQVIAKDPHCGDRKKGKLKDIYTRPIHYQKSQYRIAYTIHEDIVTVEIIQAASRENFYKELSRKIP